MRRHVTFTIKRIDAIKVLKAFPGLSTGIHRGISFMDTSTVILPTRIKG
jgi:hypothetical protein